MFRRTILLLVPSMLWADRGQTLYQSWHDSMKKWLTLANARQSNQAYSLQEYEYWRESKKSWRNFSAYVDKYYKGEPNDTE